MMLRNSHSRLNLEKSEKSIACARGVVGLKVLIQGLATCTLYMWYIKVLYLDRVVQQIKQHSLVCIS